MYIFSIVALSRERDLVADLLCISRRRGEMNFLAGPPSFGELPGPEEDEDEGFVTVFGSNSFLWLLDLASASGSSRRTGDWTGISTKARVVNGKD